MNKALLKRYNIIGDNIRYYRKLKGFNQTQLAFGSHISLSYLSQIENGSVVPSLRVILRIGEALSISPAFLLLLTDPSSHSSDRFLHLYGKLSPRSKVEVRRYMEVLLEEGRVR